MGYSAMAMNNAVTFQGQLQQVAVANVGKVLDNINNSSVHEAVAINKMATGNDLASVITALSAAMSSNQQGVKTAQTTPPVT